MEQSSNPPVIFANGPGFSPSARRQRILPREALATSPATVCSSEKFAGGRYRGSGRALLDHLQAAGSIFLGEYSPESIGDYCSGTNHVLPTNGAARAFSGVSLASFQNFISVQEATRAGLAQIGPCAITLANIEGLQAHAQAVQLRLESVA